MHHHAVSRTPADARIVSGSSDISTHFVSSQTRWRSAAVCVRWTAPADGHVATADAKQ